MPNNVKSYKKIDEKVQTAKFTVFSMGKCGTFWVYDFLKGSY